jgi:alkylation response protein AidB-like acyl-CoA dehydrogenase
MSDRPAGDSEAAEIEAVEIEVGVARAEAFVRAALPATWIDAIDRDDAEALASSRRDLALDDWWHAFADAGYATPTWPRDYGGLGLRPPVGAAVRRTLQRYKLPRTTNPVGMGQAGPALLEWGTEEQRQRFLVPIARHDEIWCQLFSEPGAGSDLAGLSTRAVRDGEVWTVHGQKVWTSVAQQASFGLLLARTDPDAPKHRGITAFILPMRQPGVTVRPLKDIAGDAPFNEVFMDGAEVPDSLRLGEMNDGWRVALSVLTGERQTLGGGGGGGSSGTIGGRTVDALIRRHAPIADPGLRERLTRAYIDERLLQLTNQRAAARQRAGQRSGPESSVSKLFNSEHMQRVQNLAVDLEGAGGMAWDSDDRWRTGNAWSLLWVRSRTIAGGTSEIQRNILGERVLGLPKEPQADRDVPWSETRR